MRQAGGFGISPFRRRAGYGFGGGYGGGYGGYGSGGCGCLSGMVSLVALVAILLFAVPAACTSRLTGCSYHSSSSYNSSSHSSQTSSRRREKLPASKCVESSRWIDDQAGWLDDEDDVVDAMGSFYEMTGVQPYLVIAEDLNGNKNYSESDVERYLRNLYDELYTDDGHLILLFLEPYENEYDPYMIVGQAAQDVVDTEGEDIIYEAIDHWYTDSSLNDDEYFSRIFIASANALMYGTSFSEFR